MLKRAERNLIVGLDIGTSKVVALVGEVGLDGSIELLGLGGPRVAEKKYATDEGTKSDRQVDEKDCLPCEAEDIFLGDVSLLRKHRACQKKADNRRNHVLGTHSELSVDTEIKSAEDKRLSVFCFP